MVCMYEWREWYRKISYPIRKHMFDVLRHTAYNVYIFSWIEFILHEMNPTWRESKLQRIYKNRNSWGNTLWDSMSLLSYFYWLLYIQNCTDDRIFLLEFYIIDLYMVIGISGLLIPGRCWRRRRIGDSYLDRIAVSSALCYPVNKYRPGINKPLTSIHYRSITYLK